ncbi:MAG: hypothetical protein KC800_18190 [Candidatus Eremiobacteraeota bacterium]|nr:hypothetical protein [Candidatus Eremiobacteraeota bacterium]
MELDTEVIDYEPDSEFLEPWKKDPIGAVRNRPGMYVGDTTEAGAFHVLDELVANALDQFLQGEADLIRVCHEGLRIQVYDNGAGFPMTDPLILKSLQSFHDKPTADDHAPHVHLALRGVGLFPINALSKRFSLQTVYRDQKYDICFEEGALVSKEEGAELPFERGTRVTADLDPTIFACNELHRNFVRKRLFETAHLFPGLAVEVNEERFKTTGLMQLAELHRQYGDCSEHRFKETRRFEFTGSSERIRLNLALVGNGGKSPTIRSWVNGAPTPKHGTHVRGVLQAASALGWVPETLLVSIIFNEVQYAGPTRDELATEWVPHEISELLAGPLAEFIQSWP